MRSVRALISLFVAAVFAIAATPGSMAMPSSHPSHQVMAMDCEKGCDHTSKPDNGQGTPCKNMAVCLGMLGCFGMAAIDGMQVAPMPSVARAPVVIVHQAVSGLTLQPDNPPPIA